MRIKIVALLSLSYFILIGFSPKTLVSFQSGSWTDLKKQSLDEHKLFFIEFDANYCASCRKMDNSTFVDSKLAAYMNDNVIAKRIDIQDFDGFRWSQQYDVDALPTMLIFDRDGLLKKRIVGYKTAQQLLDQFSIIDQKQTLSHKPQPVSSDQPLAIQPTSKPKTNKAKSFQDDKWLSDEKTARGNGLYEVDIQKKATNGFTVQVGVFSSYEGTLNQADLMSRKYSKKLFIHIDTHNGSTVYKLLLGQFDTKENALQFRNDLRKDHTDGLIKDLALLK